MSRRERRLFAAWTHLVAALAGMLIAASALALGGLVNLLF